MKYIIKAIAVMFIYLFGCIHIIIASQKFTEGDKEGAIYFLLYGMFAYMCMRDIK